MLRYPLKIFDSRRNTEKEIKFYKEVIAKFKELISKWKEFRSISSIIEDVFKLAKKAYSMGVCTDIRGVLSKSTLL
jgi:hypothetical protein